MKINKMLSKRSLQRAIIILSMVLIISIFVLFKTKFRAEHLSRDLEFILSRIDKKKQELEILEAEMNYLTTPQRIEKLTKKSS